MLGNYAKNYHSFNVLATEVKEKFVIENSSYEPKSMKLEIASCGNKGIIEFWYVYCKVCQKKVDGIMEKYRDKLLEHAKIEKLMNNWDILGISFEPIDIVGCVIPDGIKHKDIYIGLDARKYLVDNMNMPESFTRKKKLYLKKIGV